MSRNLIHKISLQESAAAENGKKNGKSNFGFRGVQNWLHSIWTTPAFHQFLVRQLRQFRNIFTSDWRWKNI